MKHLDNIKKYRQSLEKKFDIGFVDGWNKNDNSGSMTGVFKYAYLAGHKQGSLMRIKNETK